MNKLQNIALKTNQNLKKPHQSRLNIKVILAVFFYYRGVVHSEFLPDGQMVNKEYYLGITKHLCENIRRKRPYLWKNNSWILHHNTAPSHTSILIREFLAKISTNFIDQASYSPDIAPCDFSLIPRLELPLQERCFDLTEAIK